MTKVKRSLLLLSWGLVVLCAPSVVAAETDLITPMITWLKEQEEGVFNDNLEIRRADPKDPESRFGMFTKGDIAEDDILLVIPRDMLITAGADTDSYGGMWCPTVFNLIKELKLGEKSHYAPYVKYLLSQEEGQLPSHWTPAGQDLLIEMLAQDDEDYGDDLPPAEVCAWITHEWNSDCGASTDRFEQHAALLLIQRGWDDIMIPVYDMMSHRNGKWLNTKSNSVHVKSTPVQVRASRDIKAGEEIYTSYNFCEDCGNKLTGYGTAEIFRDFGFVENYPQRWFFGRGIMFILDEDEETGELEVEWIKKKPKKKAVRYMQNRLEQLKEFGDFELEAEHSSIPANEMGTIKYYQESIINAMEHALENLGVDLDHNGCDDDDHSCALAVRYDDLGWREDDLNYAVYTCDTDISMSYEGWETLEELHSHYQKLDYVKDPRNDNVCFDISNIIQMCGSYRPHYHEMVVHYTARYLNDIKRVLWVGGGDSMLLHEILKYPSLEFVVGLEIDQVVTRLSYKHLGTQPHFDNEKVQWWYGDAAKSLLMLPEEYFGSFDMVLVDLSETVMSLTVTDGLDIMQALSLLLKPDGIYVKNELYLEQMSDVFDYSIQIHFPGVPVMCSQCLIFGSNKIDFLYKDLTDHGVENLYVPPLAEIDDRYLHFHDYRRNSTSQHLCKEDAEQEAEPTEQTRSPGVLMVLEMEDLSTNLKDPKTLLDTITEAVESEGLKVVSSTSSTDGKGPIVTAIMREGYVIARAFPEFKYCSMDLHLWSSYRKQDDVKKALSKAMGSKSKPSAYRIVAGGMFGVATWKDDEKKRGPRVTDLCNRESTASRDGSMEKKVADTMLEESMKLIDTKDITVAVVCGEKKEDCSSIKVLQGVDSSITVVPLLTCPGIGNEFAEGAIDRMVECEKSVYSSLTNAVSKSDTLISAVIFDTSTPLSFARVAYKILKARKKSLLATSELFAFAVKFDGDDEGWRRHLMERFRKDVIRYDPAYRAEILFNNTESSVELGLASSGDLEFVRKVVNVVTEIEKKTGLVSDVRDIQGGLFVKDPDWKPSHFFLPEDYDQTSPLEQYLSQQPVGYQTVFQLEPKSARTKFTLTMDKITSALKDTLSGMETLTVEEGKEVEALTLHKVDDVGDGGVVVASWSGGNVLVLWDGRKHVDLNLFTYEESPDVANELASLFKAHFPKKFVTALQDVQPRGYGRVVNFLSDMSDDVPRKHPHWAKFKDEKK